LAFLGFLPLFFFSLNLYYGGRAKYLKYLLAKNLPSFPRNRVEACLCRD